MRIPISDAQLEENPYLPPYYHPGEQDEAIQYLHERRRALGGYLPERRTNHTGDARCPDDSAYAIAKKGSGTQEIATTMAFVRLLKDLLRAKDFGNRIVPIIPDEARTFGMDAFFPTAKIYNPNGQHYTSVDRELLLAYKESPQGQILHVGINEAGARRGVHRRRHVVRDAGRAAHPGLRLLLDVRVPAHRRRRCGRPATRWRAASSSARPPAAPRSPARACSTPTATRTLLASTNPAVVSYDPAYGYEIGHIVRVGPRPHVRRATTPTRTSCTTSRSTTSRSCSPPSPRASTSTASCAASTACQRVDGATGPKAQLLASGVAVPWALEAQQLLANDWGVVGRRLVGHELDRAAPRRPRRRRAQLPQPRRRAAARPYLTQKLAGAGRPVRRGVATSCTRCRTRSAPYVPGRLRHARRRRLRLLRHAAAARRFFKIDGPSVVVRTLELLADRGEVDRSLAARRRSRSTGCTT